MTSAAPPFQVPAPPASMLLRDRYEAWLVTRMPRRRDTLDTLTEPPALQHVAGQITRRGVRWGHLQAERTAVAWQALRDAWQHAPDRVWIWSDLHLWHTNVCRHTGRPFTSVDAMNAALLAHAQARVAPDDWLLFLGDLSFGSAEDTTAWLQACPGRKALIVGNHDVDRQRTREAWAWAQFEAVGSTLELPAPATRVDGVDTLWLTHYPLWSTWVPPHVLNVHGHIHQHVIPGPFVNVSVEQTGLAPQRLSDRLRSTP